MSSAKQQIYKVITKKHGLTLKTDALKYLQTVVSELPPEELEETLSYIATSYIQQQSDSGHLIVDRASLEEVVEAIFRKAAINQALENSNADDQGAGGMVGDAGVGLDDVSAYLHVIDAFDMPRFSWKADGKGFVKNNDQPHLLAAAPQKSALYSDRFDLIRQRILRNDAFRSSTFLRKDDSFEIMPIKNLQGHKPGAFLLFGMLTQVVEGKYHLEDPDALIELEINQKIAKGTGLFTLNCFVLVEGWYTEDRTFRVKTLGMPLPEPRTKSLAAYGHNVNFFGAPHTGDDQVVLENIETTMSDVMFVVVSDVWLDQPRVVMKLRQLFEGFSSAAAIRPLAIILIGSFISSPYVFDSASSAAYKDCWNTLADLLSDFRELAQECHFILIPGPNDPWSANIMPRKGIPEYFMGRMKQKAPKLVLASNPCRIKYCSQEILIFREDLLSKMRRNAIVSPASDDNVVPIEQHLVATIVDQAHLCPLPITIRPAFWAWDHALRMYPQPHLLILADKYDAYSLEYEGCQCVNPGSFPNVEYGFLVYWPATKTCQISKIGA
ncbi:DNA polymerase alpha/epsilon subunit B-domain-containing protein [Fimicolochytrium jonesii]|uniref:DNA polymerase alpha/epsilon subunit B-domain-containing protein n=1 Tax=Fimicolochytrium jonesii TaxID=1396493 RepID=UPI0022FE9297|nr:DNA polymerase alpha/epsilon subunit B-domain-containing protein [Fimicolochytrium jonesii]KAI8816342.1 DNA polymerase alpha/epsilon subunit B-domain-containing protein [Fimicolochytrium jonesii]